MKNRPRLLLVHGSVVNADVTWAAQRPLVERFELVAPNRRGFPPGPDVERVDFEDEAAWFERWLEPDAGDVADRAGDARGAGRGADAIARTHVVGHSYGGVIALLAAARRPERVRSLTVVEPPAFRIAFGRDGVDAFVASGQAIWDAGPSDPGAFLRTFLRWVGATAPPGELSPGLLQGARTLRVERLPWEAEVPLDALAAAGFPVLAISGGHEPAFEAVCDVLAERVAAERVVLPGAGHSVQRLGAPFNEVLAAFVAGAETGKPSHSRDGL